MRRPRTLKELAAHPSVRKGPGQCFRETDELGSSIWVFLAPGLRWDCDGLHTVHEDTVAEAITQVLRAAPCGCDECELELKGGV